MIKDRSLTESDMPSLTASLANDAYHQYTAPEFFTAPGTVCNVYEDEAGPICYVRGTKALRLDLHFADNAKVERNLTALVEGVSRLVEKARENGFTEIIARTSSPFLAGIATQQFGFSESAGELRKAI